MINEVLLLTLAAWGFPAPQTEYLFAPPRKFCFDVAWPEKKVALEIEGGIYTRQAHGSIKGILRDIEKYNLAALNGWCVIRVLPKWIEDGKAENIIRAALGGG